MIYDQVACVVGGKEELRPLDHYEVGQARDPHFSEQLAIPKLWEGEEIRWMLNDARPHIIKVQL